MTRAEWQDLARSFLAEARSLLAGSHWGLAYYVAGYAVECALKACILKRLAGDLGLTFDDGGFAKNVRTHSLRPLFEYADLDKERDAEEAANTAFRRHWLVVKEWTEESRYRRRPEADARALLEAITDPNDGVLTWIEKRWA